MGDRISGGLPQSNPVVERRPIAGAAFAVVIEHLNDSPVYSWTVDYDKVTLDAATQFRFQHAQSIPVLPGIAQGTLQILLDDGTCYFLQNCSRPKVRCVSYVGRNVVFEYSVQYGNATDTFNPV